MVDVAKDQLGVVIEGFRKRLAHRRRHPGPKSSELFYEAIIKTYQSIADAKEEGKPLVWSSAIVPVEIFYAMDVVPFMPEPYCAIVASQLNLTGYMDMATSYGYPVELCSFHRLILAMAENNELPLPDILIHNSQVCDSSLKDFDLLSGIFQCPIFMVEQPFCFDETGIKYYKKELQRLIEFLEETTQRKLDYDRLGRVLELSNEAMAYQFEYEQLRKTVPTPVRAKDAFRTVNIKWMAGTEEAVAYFRSVRDEAAQMVENQRGAIPEERYRLYWAFAAPPMYANDICDWLETEYGAVFPVDMHNVILEKKDLDLSDPLGSLARKYFFDHLIKLCGAPLKLAIEDVVRVAEDYRIDGVVFPAHLGCKHGCAMIRGLRDALKERAGIPSLILDCDLLDPSIMPPDELRRKFEEFLEILENR